MSTLKLRKPKTKFHQQILNRIHNKPPTNTTHILNQYIEHNQYIQIGNKPIIIQPTLKTLANIKIGDIVNSNTSIMTNTDLTNK